MVLNVGLTHFVGTVEKEFVEDVQKRTNGASSSRCAAGELHTS